MKAQPQLMTKDGKTLIPECRVANDFFSRFRGLMGRKSIGQNEAMVFPQCNSIHTFFMRFPIDVVMVDSNGTVVDIVSSLSPWRLLMPRWKAKHVIELRAERSRELGIVPGTRLEFQGVWG
jgi:uncharacterized membrane protein (UPF0127 family)